MDIAKVNLRSPTVNGKRVREATTFNSGADRNVRLACNLDPDVLECPICIEPLSTPVYQCQNGHQLCSTCRKKIQTCPSCSQPIGNIRCLLAENILESLQVSCKYASHGCEEIMKYTSREDHIKNLCAYRPCPCPYSDCLHQGPKQTLPQHLKSHHRVNTVPFRLNTSGRLQVKVTLQVPDSISVAILLLKDEKERVQLLLHLESIKSLGYMLYCTTFEDYAMKYDLTVSLPSNEEAYTMRVDASAQDIRQRENWKRDALVFIRAVAHQA